MVAKLALGPLSVFPQLLSVDHSVFQPVWEPWEALFVRSASGVRGVPGVFPAGCYHLRVVVVLHAMALAFNDCVKWCHSPGSGGWCVKAPCILACWD